MNELFSGTSLETLTNQLERLRMQIKEQEQVIAQLRLDCQVIYQQLAYLFNFKINSIYTMKQCNLLLHQFNYIKIN